MYSGLRWLSSSSAEITRARAVLDSLRNPGVIDELGFLMLNAAFAQRLYPGVTTIMTRARYLIFVPAMYRYLEQSRKTVVGKDVDRIARDLQFDLRNALEKNEASFIGMESDRNLVRTPAAIYWSALGDLGIATRRISEASYQSQLSEGLFALRVYRDDDDAAHDEERESLWTQDLKLGQVLSDGEFPSPRNPGVGPRQLLLEISQRSMRVRDNRPRLDSGRLLFHGGIDRGVATVRKPSAWRHRMNQNAKRNLQRRKRQANRLSKREYFKTKKEALNVAAAAKG